MGNKTSTPTEYNIEAKEHDNPAQESEEAKPSSKEQHLERTTMDLASATSADLTALGLPEDLAGILSQQGSNLKTVTDVVSILESSGKTCKVEFEDEFIAKVSSGRVVVERKLVERVRTKSKRSFSFGWKKSKSDQHEASGSDPEHESSVKKRKSFNIKFPSKKRQRSKSPESDDEVPDEGNDSENGDKLEEPVNINTATEEELEAIKGFGPAVSKKIIAHREEHGPFHDVDELSAVRGVSKKLIKKLGAQLTVGDVADNSDDKHVAHLQAPIKLNAVGSGGTLKHHGRDVVRLLSWNVQCFDKDKAANEGVCEVICRAVFESGVSIVVLQEIGDEEAIIKIRDELNNPTLKGVKKSRGHRGHWECITSDVAGTMFRSREYNGFLWDASRDIELKSSDLLEKPKKGKKQFARRPFLGFFKTKGLDFVVVSVHLKATGLENEDISRLQKELGRMPDIITALQENVPGEKDMIVVGDFNLDPDEKDFDCFRGAGLSNLIPSTSYTNISTSNMDGSKCYDNIWVSKQAKDKAHTGRAGVVRSGMTHSKIPDGWKWGGVVSDHCPVWAEFYCDQDTDKSTGEENVEDIAIATDK